MSEASRTNEAERVEFSRLSIIRLNAYSARKEGKTEAQENDFAAELGFAADIGRWIFVRFWTRGTTAIRRIA